MFYVVALGNPGEEYVNTRHNVGWTVLDTMLKARNFTEPVSSAKYQGQLARGMIGGEEVEALYPHTFMNHSGVAVKKLVANSDLTKLIVLHDDIALPLGEIKISVGRGDGGHNGIRSIVKELGSNDFVRIRIGIAQKNFFTGKVKRPSGEKLPRFVLGKFTSKEQVELTKLEEKALAALLTIVTEGVEQAMNIYNAK